MKGADDLFMILQCRQVNNLKPPFTELLQLYIQVIYGACGKRDLKNKKSIQFIFSNSENLTGRVLQQKK